MKINEFIYVLLHATLARSLFPIYLSPPLNDSQKNLPGRNVGRPLSISLSLSSFKAYFPGTMITE